MKRLILLLGLSLIAVNTQPLPTPMALCHSAIQFYDGIPPKIKNLGNNSLLFIGLFSGVTAMYVLSQELQKKDKNKKTILKASVCVGGSAVLCSITLHNFTHALLDKKQENAIQFLKETSENLQDQAPGWVKWSAKKLWGGTKWVLSKAPPPPEETPTPAQ